MNQINTIRKAINHALKQWAENIESGSFIKSTGASGKFALAAFKNRQDLTTFEHEIRTLSVLDQKVMRETAYRQLSEPYISSRWQTNFKLKAISDHYRFADEFLPWPTRNREFRYELKEICSSGVQLKLVLDRPTWFLHEGELVLNLFSGEIRVMSIAFSLINPNGSWTCAVGAFQGTHKSVSPEDRQRINKEITKGYWGLRPRNLLLFCLRQILIYVNVTSLIGVADDARIHRHSFYSKNWGDDINFLNNYDEIWQDLGATSRTDDFYVIPIEEPRRAIESIDSHKRSLYRKRYAFLDALSGELKLDLSKLLQPKSE
jgi:uncharacterized protein VirK/YbjX